MSERLTRPAQPPRDRRAQSQIALTLNTFSVRLRRQGEELKNVFFSPSP
jgi:hypothetical protein